MNNAMVVDLTGGSDDEPDKFKPNTFTPTKPTMGARRKSTIITSTDNVNLVSDDEDESVVEKKRDSKVSVVTIDQTPVVPRPTTATHSSATPTQSSYCQPKPQDHETSSSKRLVQRDAIPDVIDSTSAQKDCSSSPVIRSEGPSAAAKAATVAHSPPLAWRPAPTNILSGQNDQTISPDSETKDTEMVDVPIEEDQGRDEAMDVDKDHSASDDSDEETTQSDTQSESSDDEAESEDAIASRLPLSLEAFQTSLKTILGNLRQDHADMVKASLFKARTSHSKRHGDPSHQYIQTTSPFTNLKPIPVHMKSKEPGFFEQLILKGVKPNIVTEVTAVKILYKVEVVPIPPFHEYISTKRNVLMEDVKHRTFLPYHGDDAMIERDYAIVEEEIKEDRAKYHYLNEIAEKAKRHVPYVQSFLSEIGCTVTDVLYYLLDESNPKIPDELPEELARVWVNREVHIQEDYYSDSDDSGKPHFGRQSFGRSKRPRRQWQAVFDGIKKIPEGRRLAAAALACKTFAGVAGFSLWHVVKLSVQIPELSRLGLLADDSDTGTPTQENGPHHPHTKKLHQSTYADLGCLVCFAHDCPGHGEYGDDGGHSNVRFRLNAKPLHPAKVNGSTNGKEIEPSYPRPSEAMIKGALGLNDDKSVTGQPLIAIADSDYVYRDDEKCSKSCFWLKSNRVTELPDWSDEDTQLFLTLLPAYMSNRRGACIIALAVEKLCAEIYLKMLETPKETIAIRVKGAEHDPRPNSKPAGKRNAEYWHQNSITWKHHERPPFSPCSHEGSCQPSNSNCTCITENVTCEKSCMCSASCTRRFQGCSCHAKGKVCWGNDKCDCYRLDRECDPDLCRSCGAREVLDPVNRYREDIAAHKCTNVYVQRSVPRRTLLGHSKLLASGGMSGWGLYMGEPVKNGDYIGEYVGEVITSEECERRGLIYDKRNLSYLFDLNGMQTLDSTRVGNKFRYINHQSPPYANCKAKILLCDTVHRIGMFACQNIEVGDEILFDYGETFTSRFNLIKLDEKGQAKIEGKRTKKVGNKEVPDEVPIRKVGTKGRPRIPTGRKPGRPRLYPIHEGPGDIRKEKTKSSRKRRRSAIHDDDVVRADEVELDEDGEMWDLSSSESYHESDAVVEEEVAAGLGRSKADVESEHDNPQKRGWRTRMANMAKREAEAEAQRKRGQAVRRGAR